MDVARGKQKNNIMKLYSINNSKLKSLAIDSFKLEKEIQTLVENNLEVLFNLQFVKSEFSIKNFRIDTLAFDTENKSFVVVEYKKGSNFSVIDQGYTYMSLMLNNKADFILEYNEKNTTQLKKDDVDWSQSKVVFISPQFTEFQKHSVNFKDVPFELWEIKRYENNLVGMVQYKSNSNESISIVTDSPENIVSKVSKQVKVYDEEYHLNSSKNRLAWVNELYFVFKERILSLGDVEVKYTAQYVSFRTKSPFVDLILYNKGVYTVINMKSGSLNDPDNKTYTYDGKGHWGNGDYYVIIDDKTDIDYVMFLIKQSYIYHR